MTRTGIESIIAGLGKTEKALVVTGVLQSHGGYSASHNEVLVSKKDVRFEDEYLVLNVEVSLESGSDAGSGYVEIGSIHKYPASKAALYIGYDEVLAIMVIDQKNTKAKV
jgi:hypothetical protein